MTRRTVDLVYADSDVGSGDRKRPAGDGTADVVTPDPTSLVQYVKREARLYDELVHGSHAAAYRFSALPTAMCDALLRNFVTPSLAVVAVFASAMDAEFNAARVWRTAVGPWVHIPLDGMATPTTKLLPLPDKRVLFSGVRPFSTATPVVGATSLFAPFELAYRALQVDNVRTYSAHGAFHARTGSHALVHHARSDRVFAVGGVHNTLQSLRTYCRHHRECNEYMAQQMPLARSVDAFSDRVGAPWASFGVDPQLTYKDVAGTLFGDALYIVGVRGVYSKGLYVYDASVYDLHSLQWRRYTDALCRAPCVSHTAVHAARDGHCVYTAHGGSVVVGDFALERFDTRDPCRGATMLNVRDALTNTQLVPVHQNVAWYQANQPSNAHLLAALTGDTHVSLFDVENTQVGCAAPYDSIGLVAVSEYPAHYKRHEPVTAWLGSIDLRNERATRNVECCQQPVVNGLDEPTPLRQCVDVCIVKQF